MMQQKDKCTFCYLQGSRKNRAIVSATPDQMLSFIINFMKRLIESMSPWLWYTQPPSQSIQSGILKRTLSGLPLQRPDWRSPKHQPWPREEGAGQRTSFPRYLDFTFHRLGGQNWKYSHFALGNNALIYVCLILTSSPAIIFSCFNRRSARSSSWPRWPSSSSRPPLLERLFPGFHKY